jgi:hypothetical protein
MSDKERNGQRPLWVRFMVREKTKRPVAFVHVMILGLFGCIDLVLAVTRPTSSLIFPAITRPVVLLVGGVCAAFGIWCWLAARWVDKNGTWP